VEFRLSRLREQLALEGSSRVLDREHSLAFWRAIRDVVPFARDFDKGLWRISIPPARGADVLAAIQASLPGSRAFLDWGGGLIWLQSAISADVSGTLESGQKIRAVLAAHDGGHATLVRAPAEVRRQANVLQPQAAPLAALSRRVKQQFDPKRVLNPGRMYADV
jgi:glycolate oxidase FAD binding subunit